MIEEAASAFACGAVSTPGRYPGSTASQISRKYQCKRGQVVELLIGCGALLEAGPAHSQSTNASGYVCYLGPLYSVETGVEWAP